MNIRNRLLLNFSATSIILVSVILLIIYVVFSEYREEEFQQRQKEKIITTLHFISEIEKDEKRLADAMDQLTINSILNEKLLIFDSAKNVIYASLDDVPIGYSDRLLNMLSEHNVWIEQKDGLYDVVAIYFKDNNKSYYGISKAYDEFGYSKLKVLRRLLIGAFVVFTFVVILVCVYISNRISKPIWQLTDLVGNYKIGDTQQRPKIQTNTHEIDFLNQKFNELLSKINSAYTFQQNAVHHISHQLKTPITVLISELERIRQKTSDSHLQQDIQKQILRTKSLAEIINTMLEISKVSAGQSFEKTSVRIDEILFDCISELNMLHPYFIFEVNYLPAEPDAARLTISANEMLIRQGFQNLLNNSVAYSSGNKAEINIDTSQPDKLKISITNSGKTISEAEQPFLFSHFFRGENSREKAGFGLGLTLTKNIVQLHKGEISYTAVDGNRNVFEVELPLTLS
jgi:two-component system sensor histidine kinase ArlS